MNMVTGWLLLPLSKNSVWSHLFGVSCKSLIVWHTYLGGFMMSLVVLHALLWSQVYIVNIFDIIL